MKTYAFEKLYTDLVAEDGTVCIVYLAWTELLGVRSGSAGIELYTPDGRREVIHARSVPACPDIDAPSWSIVLDVPGGPFELHHAARVGAGAWRPRGDARSGIDWSVKSACADASARWLGGPRPLLRGRGYADWVVLHKMTKGLGIDRVDWGRAHVQNVPKDGSDNNAADDDDDDDDDDETLVWNRIRAKSGEEWTRVLSLSASRGTTESSDLALDERADGAVTMVPAEGPELHLDGGRVLHDGPAIDRERFPSAMLRGVARLVTPPIEETRWVRHARIGAKRGWAVHERVFFGSAA